MLLTIAAPLIVLGAPWASIWRPLPLGFRRSVAKTISRSSWCAPLRGLGRLLSRPIPVWIVLNANLVAWHVPALYDLAVRDRAVHDLEHVTFLVFGVLLWAQVLDSPPLRARLSAIHRVYYIVASATVGWVDCTRPGFRLLAAVPRLRTPRAPARRHLRVDRPAAGRGRDAGSWIALDHAVRIHPALPLDRGRRGLRQAARQRAEAALAHRSAPARAFLRQTSNPFVTARPVPQHDGAGANLMADWRTPPSHH